MEEVEASHEPPGRQHDDRANQVERHEAERAKAASVYDCPHRRAWHRFPGLCGVEHHARPMPPNSKPPGNASATRTGPKSIWGPLSACQRVHVGRTCCRRRTPSLPSLACLVGPAADPRRPRSATSLPIRINPLMTPLRLEARRPTLIPPDPVVTQPAPLNPKTQSRVRSTDFVFF
jgi:hypothetical protein